MAQLLNFIINEWCIPISIVIFFALTVLASFAQWPVSESDVSWRRFVDRLLYKRSSYKAPEEFDRFWDRVGLCTAFITVICMHVIHMGALLARIALRTIPDVPLMGWVIVLLCTVYALLFMRALIQFVAFAKGAFAAMCFWFSSYPVFCLSAPYCYFHFLSLWGCNGSSFRDFSYEWPSSHFWGSCLIAVPWLIYLSISSEMKRWYELKTKKELEQHVSTDVALHK